jgi:hypothetical protein
VHCAADAPHVVMVAVMFKPFSNNPVWALSVNLAIDMGAPAGDVVAMCGRLQEAAGAAGPDDTQLLADAWSAMGERLCSLAQEDEVHGRLLSAGEKYNRAAIYYAACERLQATRAPNRQALYRRFLDLFALGAALCNENCRRVEIPYEGHSLAALFVRAEGVPGAAPVLVQLNGLDSTKEIKYRLGLPTWLARRGVSSLIIDQPGTGEALRLQGLTARADSEHWARQVVDWLETRADVDPRCIGVEGPSLGSYHCPRVAAFERRFACGVVWGAHHDWWQLRGRPRADPGLPLPHYWEHACWSWGVEDVDELAAVATMVQLDAVLPRIRVPFLVTSREDDTGSHPFLPRIDCDRLTNSPMPQAKVFCDRDGGVPGVGFGRTAGHYIADWVAETLGGRTAHLRAGHRRSLYA